ncbi:MAG TPA: penicillin-binding protein 2 [Candidatus Acidoferrales bacterium]|jgi:penicillin-binding protein 2|nr:penicillin-binding protein 2 [Candidatus Acidoferrales bacterium]
MWFENESRVPQGRLAIVSYVIVGAIALLLLGFWKLQIIESERYTQLAERNRIRSLPIIAPRGRMLDREGRVLVDNYPSFSVLLLREDPQQVERYLPQVAEGLSVPLEDLQKQLEEAKSLPKFQPIVVKPEASQSDIAFIESHRADIPLIEMLMVHRRRYLPNGFMAHASGYVGEVNAAQVEASNGRYRPGDLVGKAGLERQYNEILVGTDGLRRSIVNSVGKEMGRLEQKEAVPGKQIQLTIDYDLQVVAEQALTGKKGAVVALDPRTGEVLAMVSHPAPDPNLFAIRVPRDDWKRLNEDPDRPLLNRAIQAQLAPGSVFKIIMATAMLESKAIPENFSIFCTGMTEFYGRTFHCWQKHGHGSVSLHKAVVQSCDVFFYNVGKRLGIDRIAYYASHLGLGRRTGIDLPSEETGLMPSEEWKQRVFHQKWYPGETISVAIGQGAVVTTPLQLAHTLGGIASGGIFKQPHLLMNNGSVLEERFPLSEDTTEKITQAMFGVVNEGGTAAGVRVQGIELCGKTGSAQVISAQGLKRAGKQSMLKDNAWFVGYAPRRNPEIVVSVLVQEGEHGASAAAPIARDVIKAFYDKKSKRTEKQYAVEYRRYEINGEPTAEVPPTGQPGARPEGPNTTRAEP